MLKNWKTGEKPSAEELDRRLDEARLKLAAKQIAIKDKKLPVMVVLEGWGAAGKGSVLGRIIKNMDPRFFKVSVMSEISEEEKRKPFLYRHFVRIPEAGQFMFFDGSWMDEVTGDYLKGKLKKKQYEQRITSIKRFERQLTDNGYLLMKFFFHIGEKEQKKRIDELLEDKNTKWRVSGDDLWQNKNYDKCLKVYDEFLEETNSPSAPWYLIDSKNKKWAELQMLELLLRELIPL